ncbi:MAG TPA: putative Ig domain-containing protein, partial [Opitutaceae bacterium]|nr:putative Ig domain-containing protein [Opitutaceae bacterium]
SAVVTIVIAAGGTAPTIAAQTASGTQGQLMSYQVVASGATSFSTTSTLPAGLNFSTAGVISGTPSAAGSTNINVTATNANGSNSAVVTIAIAAPPPPSAPVIVSGGTASANAGSAFSYSIAASNSPTSYGATNLPSGLSINTASGTISGTAPAAGTYSIGLSATNGAGTGTKTLTLTVSTASTPPPPPPPPPVVITPPPPAPVKSSQTVTFTTPVSAVQVGQAISLGATASSGLPVSYQLISGNATLSGNTLTLNDTKPVSVLAVQSGNASYNAASAEATFTATKGTQAITFPALSNLLTTSGSINLSATTNAGLPITYTVVSGPASVSGNVLRLTGVAGTVVVRASQSGNDSWNAATEVTRSFAIGPVGQQVYFGTIGADAFACAIDRNNANGTLVLRLAATGQAVIVKFTINPNGSFSAKAKTIGGTAATQANGTPATAAAAGDLTFTGSVNNGVLSGTIEELGRDFSANVQPATGSTASLAGIYHAGIPGSASGDTYIVVGANGQAYALTATPAGVISGSGTVTADGRIAISTAANSSIAATVDASSGAINGTVTAAGVTSTFTGISAATERTDRLVNLSSRVRVTAGDGSRAVIAGFVITGTENKQILLRAVGPGLTGFGVTDALANPKLQLFDSTGKVIAENDDWSGTSDISATGDRVGAFKLTAGSRDSALVATVAPGLYTAQVTSTSGNGVVLLEVYDAATGTALSAQQLVNISTRGYVDTGEGQLVAGFVVTGNTPKKVLIRGIGPGLTAFGVPGAVADPMLKVYAAGNPTPIAQNDNWSTATSVSTTQMAATSAEISAANTAVGAFPLAANSKDAAVVITLTPGNYSAVVSGVGGQGAGLVEVYQISDL